MLNEKIKEMKWFIKRFKNGQVEYLHKNLTWVNPLLYRKDVLVTLDYWPAKQLALQMKEFDSSIRWTNRIIE